MSRHIYAVVVVGLCLAMLQGCFMLAGAAAGSATKIDPKEPKAETAANCQAWECFDGYACHPCGEGAANTPAPTKK